MSNCSINTECHMDDLVSAIQDVVDARDMDLSSASPSEQRFSIGFFNTRYARLADAINDASVLIEQIESRDHRNRLVSTVPADILVDKAKKRRAA